MLGSQITLGCAGFTYLESQYFFKNRVKVRQNCYIWNIRVKMSQKDLFFYQNYFKTVTKLCSITSSVQNRGLRNI